MISAADINITLDDKEHVFSNNFFNETNGCIKLKIYDVSISLTFKEDDSSEDKSPKTKLTTEGNKLEVTCINHDAYSPISRGIVRPIPIFTRDGAQYYMQLTSSI